MAVPRRSEINPEIYRLFKRGSRTYFNSTLFFPREVRSDVFKLYAFLRKADNFVDILPQDYEGFYTFRREYERAVAGYPTSDVVVKNFVELSERRKFDPLWATAFLDAMESDLYVSEYETLDQLCRYMYGSAEVVGLFMSKIMDLPEESYAHARFLGRAMQYINFIRDIVEDYSLGRTYLPLSELRSYGMHSLNPDEIREKRESFDSFVRAQIHRYFEWQRFAEEGYKYIPVRYLIPVKTAADMYKWTARIIFRQPSIVLVRKVKPSKTRIILSANVNLVSALRLRLAAGGHPW